MKLLVLGFPHQLTLDPRPPGGMPEQFTELIWNFCFLMQARGHEVIHIGAPGSSPPPGVEQVDVGSSDEWQILYGGSVSQVMDISNAHGEHRRRFAHGMRQILLDRGGDPHTSVICALWHADGAADNVPQFTVEYSIGYPNARAQYRVYQSHAWRHFNEGQENNAVGNHWDWRVIPWPIDLSLFGPATEAKENYLLCFCRMTENKGVRIAVKVAQAAGIPIRLAGRGDGAQFVQEWPEGSTYLGPITVAQRRELLRKARALLCPTRYMEPMGTIAVEAQASGCPVISTNWGGFTESVVHADPDGRRGTGWRCNTFEDFLWAVKNAHKIDPFVCREWIARNQGFERTAVAYEEYFTALLRLREGGGGWMSTDTVDSRVGLQQSFRDYSMFGRKT